MMDQLPVGGAPAPSCTVRVLHDRSVSGLRAIIDTFLIIAGISNGPTSGGGSWVELRQVGTDSVIRRFRFLPGGEIEREKFVRQLNELIGSGASMAQICKTIEDD